MFIFLTNSQIFVPNKPQMLGVDRIFEYFPELTSAQKQQLEALGPLYQEWNQQINVISRKDMEAFYERHVLHSLALSKVQSFRPGASILDVGTGGGFPGIPLAILFPETKFKLVDSIGKKIKVVQEVAKALEINNVVAQHKRAEDVTGTFDFVVSRAVTRMERFVPWIADKFKPAYDHSLSNGILYLKGGDLEEELKPFPKAKCYPIPEFFQEPFFETKQVVYLPMG